MAIKTFNYTNRKHLDRKCLKAFFERNGEGVNLTVNFRLDDNPFPPSARVLIQPHRNQIYERFELGKVQNSLDGVFKLDSNKFKGAEKILLKILVVETESLNKNRILGRGESFAVLKSAQGGKGEGEGKFINKGIIETDTANLGDEVWKAEFYDNKVTLIINEKFEDWKELARHEVFMGFVYPAFLKLVLNRIVFIENYFEIDEYLDDWKDKWLKFVEKYLELPDVNPEEDKEVWAKWIDVVVKDFSSDLKTFSSVQSKWSKIKQI